jgi:hypothetical protein
LGIHFDGGSDCSTHLKLRNEAVVEAGWILLVVRLKVHVAVRQAVGRKSLARRFLAHPGLPHCALTVTTESLKGILQVMYIIVMLF